MTMLDSLAERMGFVSKTSARHLVDSELAEFKRRYSLGRRRFEGAKINRLSNDTPTSPNHINDDLKSEAVVLIARARWMAQNDPYIRRGLRLIINNVVGSSGIVINPRVSSQGRMKGPLDTEMNDAVTGAWKRWASKGVFDPRNLYSLRTFDRARLHGRIRDGESFVIESFGSPTPDNPFGYWLRMVDPIRVPHELSGPAANGNQIMMGIELDGNWSPTAYYLRLPSQNIPQGSLIVNGRAYERIEASRVIHDFEAEFPEQTRGFSGMVGAMRRAPMLDGYIEAALVASRNGASTMGWYTEEDTALGDYVGDGPEDEDDGDFTEEMEPGIMRKLPRGYSVDMHNPAWPNVNHAEFVKSIVRSIAADLNVSYHSIAQDLENVNLSSIRHGSQEDREQFKQLQSDEIETFHNRILARWVPLALMANQITIGSKSFAASDTNVSRILTQTGFQARGWEFAEPLKDAQANAMNIQTGLDTPQRVVEARGGDWSDHLSQLEKNRDELASMGLDVAAANITIVNNEGEQNG